MPQCLTVLDNPIWFALRDKQAHWSEGDALARRYRYEIGPLAGLREQSADAYAALATLVRPEETIALFLDEPPLVPSGWTLEIGGQLTQMVYERISAGVLPRVSSEKADGSFAIEVLGESDVDDMLALVELSKPGPFRRETHLLGTYLGIRQAGRLVAMAGERLHVDDFVEVSAVCTHPDFQGHGYAQALIRAVVAQIAERHQTPFLHTRPDNINAIHVYEKLGFRQRRLLYLAVLRHQPAT